MQADFILSGIKISIETGKKDIAICFNDDEPAFFSSAEVQLIASALMTAITEVEEDE